MKIAFRLIVFLILLLSVIFYFAFLWKPIRVKAPSNFQGPPAGEKPSFQGPPKGSIPGVKGPSGQPF